MRIVAVLVAALVLSCACAGDAIQHEMLDGVEAIMEKDPSEALQRLSSIDTVSLQSKPLKARYALLKSMALDKTMPDSGSWRRRTMNLISCW